MNVISGAQCRMARGLLNWSVSELASLAGLGVSTVKRIEKEDGVLAQAIPFCLSSKARPCLAPYNASLSSCSHFSSVPKADNTSKIVKGNNLIQ